MNGLTTRQKGAGLLEVVIGVGIVTATVVGLTTAYGLFIRSASAQSQFIKAQFLLEEGVEAVRAIRDVDWSTIDGLANDTTYWLSFDGSEWSATTTQIYVDNFERTIMFGEVRRDGGDDIVLSGGSVDAQTRHLVVEVGWEGRSGTTTRTIETYFADIFVE